MFINGLILSSKPITNESFTAVAISPSPFAKINSSTVQRKTITITPLHAPSNAPSTLFAVPISGTSKSFEIICAKNLSANNKIIASNIKATIVNAPTTIGCATFSTSSVARFCELNFSDETFDLITDLYKEYCDDNLIMMGDSAGGGFSAAFCEYLAVKDMPQPKNIILISPWVDISMSGDYDEVEYDPMLGVDGAREMGKAWAGDLDTKDYKVSPLFGEVDKLPKTTIFIGTHEIIYPDIVKFYNKLQDNGVDAELIVGEEMSHVYPLYPMVPEAKEAFNRIAEILLD